MKRFRSILTLLVLATLLTGCAKDPFSVREGEKPLDDEGTFITPVDPLIAIENLRYAMIERNLGHYYQTHPDTLRFTFDFLLVSRPDSVSSWDGREEDRIVGNLFSTADSIALDWRVTPGRVDRFEDSTATLYRSYEIDVVAPDADSTITRHYEGEMVVGMARNALDLWWIVHWEDLHVGAEIESWADLKSSYR